MRATSVLVAIEPVPKALYGDAVHVTGRANGIEMADLALLEGLLYSDLASIHHEELTVLWLLEVVET